MPSSCLPQMCAELTVTHERANARENKEIRVWRMVLGEVSQVCAERACSFGQA